MHFVSLLLLTLVPAIFAGESNQKWASLSSDIVEAETVELTYRPATPFREAIKANFTLHCFTGDNKDGFFVNVTVQGSYNVSDKFGELKLKNNNLNGTISPEFSLSGKITDLQEKTSTDNNCTEGILTQGRCSLGRRDTVIVKQYVIVPNSVSPLAWVGNYEVEIECRYSPESTPEKLLPNIPSFDVGYCEQFNHSIIITLLPEPDVCLITVNVQSKTVLPYGIGYALKNCQVDTAFPESHTFLVQQGRTVNRPGVHVTGRNGKGFGQEYQLTVKNLNAVTAGTGVINCDVVRCRYGMLSVGNEELCPTGNLPTTDSAAVAQSLGRAAASPVNLRSGAVTLVIPAKNNARSLQEKRCPSV